MSKQRGRRIDRRTAEQVLRGVPVDATDAVTGLLAAAAAPPRDGEQPGEQAAVTAFLEAAQHAPAARSRSSPRGESTGTKLRTAKVAAAVAAVFAVGGVAAAAATGVLPLPAGGSPPAPSASGHAHPGAGSPAAPTTTREETSAVHQPAPSPSLVGLCRAYDAGGKTERGKALASPAFTALVTAAGGEAGVDGYCGVLLENEARGHATDSPSGPGRPDNGKDHPSGPPTTHPGGPSTTRPGGLSATQPAGPPATRPGGPPANHSSGPPAMHPGH